MLNFVRWASQGKGTATMRPTGSGLLTYRALVAMMAATVLLTQTFDSAFAQANVWHERMLSYRGAHESIDDLSPAQEPGAPLPDTLVISPGTYEVSGRTFRMIKGGLYRFQVYWQEGIQRIVFDGDIDTFLSAIAWATTHGVADNDLSPASWRAALMHRKLFLSCWPVSYLGRELLGQVGIPARIVSLFANMPHTGFDDGHAVLEVWRADLGKWVIYDLDNDVQPLVAGTPASTLDLMDAMERGESYELRKLSSDTPVDISNVRFGAGVDFSFFFERLFAGERFIREFYERVFGVAAIFHGNYFTVLDHGVSDEIRAYLRGLSGEYRFVSRREFEQLERAQ